MKNLDFLKYLRAQEDEAYERIKLGHFDENGAAYYRGKHDQAFAMRRDLEERLQQSWSASRSYASAHTASAAPCWTACARFFSTLRRT